ncbi:12674_t:CDS:2, partial [Acaulospora colombiana]
EDVFIHPSSVLFHQNPPEYVAFHEVVRGTKVWIKSTTRSMYFFKTPPNTADHQGYEARRGSSGTKVWSWLGATTYAENEVNRESLAISSILQSI